MGGIAVAGSLLVDKLNEISEYPKSGELTKIINTAQSVGGCVPNVAIGLKKLSPQMQVYALGKAGNDDEGRFIRNELTMYGIDVSGINFCGEKTSFTSVMSVVGGERTFFSYAGASAQFGYDEVDFDALNAKMLHLGYFLLLDKVDGGDGVKILQEATRRGIKTSIDLVSENSDRYQSVLPCLAYTDNVIVNEVEAGRLAMIEPKKENLRTIAQRIKSYGVRERVVIHLPDMGVCLSNNGFTVVPSYELPEGFIKGTTGAGDAFCSGALLGIYRGVPDEEILSFASSVAAAALSAADAVSGIKSEREIFDLCKNLKRKKGCSLI